jgi:hypothetical protein
VSGFTNEDGSQAEADAGGELDEEMSYLGHDVISEQAGVELPEPASV